MSARDEIRTSERARRWPFLLLYLALAGSFCGLELDTYIGDLPFFQIATFILFLNVISIVLLPPLAYICLFSRRQSNWIKTPALILVSLFFHIAAFLALYKCVRKIDFDFNFLWYNTADVLPVLWKIYAPWFFVVALSLAGFVFLQKPAFSNLADWIGKSPKKRGLILVSLFLASIISQYITLAQIRGSAAGFLYASFISDRRLRSDYHQLYMDHIKMLRSEPVGVPGRANPSILGDVVFFIKQESLNGLLATPQITPQLMRASKDGILFPDFYANSIQSLRGYECILCGVPPNLAGALVDEYNQEELKALNCLPQIFRSLGYHTLYFFGGSRNARIVSFAESIGFEKVLADDIMGPDDTKFDWGYREDVFYRRMYEYLARHYSNNRLFVFIDTGATNHTPFEVLDDAYVHQVPYPEPKSFEEHLSNTTFVQDAYFGLFYENFRKHYGSRGSVIAASDHSWPIPIHKDNIYNERGAFEENFRIPLLFIPPSPGSGLFERGSVVTHRFSQMDIFPTILSLMALDQRHRLGESFAPWLLKSGVQERAVPGRTKISVQPYGGGFISAVRYPQKVLFDVLGKSYSIYDLRKDPGERFPSVHSGGEHAYLIKEFFHPKSDADSGK